MLHGSAIELTCAEAAEVLARFGADISEQFKHYPPTCGRSTQLHIDDHSLLGSSSLGTPLMEMSKKHLGNGMLAHTRLDHWCALIRVHLTKQIT